MFPSPMRMNRPRTSSKGAKAVQNPCDTVTGNGFLVSELCVIFSLLIGSLEVSVYSYLSFFWCLGLSHKSIFLFKLKGLTNT